MLHILSAYCTYSSTQHVFSYSTKIQQQRFKVIDSIQINYDKTIKIDKTQVQRLEFCKHSKIEGSQSRPHKPMNIIPRVLATEGQLRRGQRYLALEVVAVPFGAVVEPLLLLVVEPRVARVAGDRRHPRSAPSSPLATDSACSGGHGRGGLSLLSFSFRCRFALYAATPRW